jgi:hypothetical protein
MKTPLIAVLPIAAMLSGCGGGPAALPETAVERAATCGVVASAEARKVTANPQFPLSAAQRGAVLRPALLASAEGEEFSRDRTAAVVKAMQELGETLDEKDVETLAPQCAQAYPPAPTPVVLPEDPLTAAMGCDELSDFIRQAFSAQGADYKAELDKYYALNQALDRQLAPLLSRRGISGVEASQAQARKEMARIVKLGEPTAILDACSVKYVKA